ncbi:MAG: thioredoxin-dependent thiol peroxidase [Patescibacteria group bacterium]
MANISIGDTAPDFTLPDQEGVQHQLTTHQGSWVLLYFYPKDDTPGCTQQACGIRDTWQAFQDNKLQVFGISKDSVKSHAKFADKYQLPFPLLADENATVCKAYGVLSEKSMFGKSFLGIVRASFLIDPSGKIAKMYPAVKPAQHAEQILNDLAELTEK